MVKIYTQNQFTIQYFLQIRFYLLKLILIMYLNLQEQGSRTFYFYYVLYGIKQEYKEKA